MLNTAHLQAIALQDPVVVLEVLALFFTFCFLLKTAKEARAIDLLTGDDCEEIQTKVSTGKRLNRLPIPKLCNVGQAIPAYRLMPSREQA